MNSASTPKMGVIWFSEHSVLIEFPFRERVWETIGREDMDSNLHLPSEIHLGAYRPWNTFVARNLSTDYLFWQSDRHVIVHVKHVIFPIRIGFGITIVMDNMRPSFSLEDQQLVLVNQREHLRRIAICASELNIRLMVLSLCGLGTHRDQYELIGHEVLSMPHVEVAQYKISDLSKLNNDLIRFLKR